MKAQATQPLVNPAHKAKQAHVLAMSGHLFVEAADSDELLPLGEWLKTRCDMPERLDEVFNPETTEDWDVNWEYLTSKERMICKFEGVNWEYLHIDNSGVMTGVHPDADIVNSEGKEEWLFTNLIDPSIMAHHLKQSLPTLKQSRNSLEREVAQGLLTGEAHKQELGLLKFLVKVKS